MFSPLSCLRHVVLCLLCLVHVVGTAEPAAERAAQVALLRSLGAQLDSAKKTPDRLQVYKPLYQHATRLKDKRLREPVCFTVALGMLYCGKRDAYVKQRKSLKALFPRSRFHQLIGPKAFREPCAECGATGESEVQCPTCRGTGKCPNALCIDGKIAYRSLKGDVVRDCPVCHAKSTCPDCEGKGKTKQPCRACAGKGGIASRDLVRKRLLAMIDESRNAVSSRAREIVQMSRLGDVKDTGRHVTPPELKERLKGFGQWMLMQQRRLDMKIVSKVYAKIEAGDAVLCLVMTSNFTDQDYDWRLTIAKACFKDWRTKCGRSEGKQYYPGMLFLDEAGTKVGEFIPAESRIWLPK